LEILFSFQKTFVLLKDTHHFLNETALCEEGVDGYIGKGLFGMFRGLEKTLA